MDAGQWLVVHGESRSVRGVSSMVAVVNDVEVHLRGVMQALANEALFT
ncbi:hypothetical protein P8631_06385 [Guyparkeria sp. 1SP6A2]|nr:hypothetical protein [Guyparkeria sp. 1SP6A2]